MWSQTIAVCLIGVMLLGAMLKDVIWTGLWMTAILQCYITFILLLFTLKDSDDGIETTNFTHMVIAFVASLFAIMSFGMAIAIEPETVDTIADADFLLFVLVGGCFTLQTILSCNVPWFRLKDSFINMYNK